MMKRGSVKVSTGFGWLRIWTGEGLREHENEPTDSVQYGGNYDLWVPEHLIFTKQYPSFKRFQPSTVCVMVISTDYFADVPQDCSKRSVAIFVKHKYSTKNCAI